jgi:hypothetical protein
MTSLDERRSSASQRRFNDTDGAGAVFFRALSVVRMGPGAKARGWSRWLLLGDDDSWGARLATSPMALSMLAGFALVMHVLDLATGIRMMQLYGLELEQNPLARAVMQTAGPIGLAEAKLAVVLAGLWLLIRVARVGRPRLARNCLVMAALIGMLGWTSNLV